MYFNGTFNGERAHVIAWFKYVRWVRFSMAKHVSEVIQHETSTIWQGISLPLIRRFGLQLLNALRFLRYLV